MSKLSDLLEESDSKLYSEAFYQGYKWGFKDGAEANRRFITNESSENPFRIETIDKWFQKNYE